jgi:drug/metabolite transporter (DMT)-like permease
MPRQNAMTGIAFKLASVCFFLSMSTLLKASDGVPSGELSFFRAFFAMVPIVVYQIYRGELIAGFKTRQPLGHLWRGLIGAGGMMTGFYALTQLPLPESIAIQYATPLLIVVLSAVFFHEQVRLYRWTAVLVGLVGVLIIMWPRLTVFSGGISNMSGATLGALVALVSSMFAAAGVVLVRRLVETESSATIVLYFCITSSSVALCTLPFGWVMPTPEQFVMLISAGIFGGIAQILLTESYRHADMSVVAPFEYASLILSVIVGYVFFRDIPTVEMLVGGTIVVASGLFIIYREHRLGLERRKASEASPPT